MVRARFLSYPGILIHIARSGATVVPRSRVQREERCRALPPAKSAASVLRIVGSSPESALDISLGLRLGREIDTRAGEV